MADLAETPDWSHSLEAEQSVIGALLLDNSAYDRIADLIGEQDFYTGDHRAIFRVVRLLIEAGKAADVVTVFDRLQVEDAQRFGALASYVGACAQNVPSAVNVRRYAELVRERSLLRRLFTVGQTICTEVMGFRGREAGQLLDAAEAAVLAVSEMGAGREEFQTMNQVLRSAYEFIDDQHMRWLNNQGSDVTGVPTGFIDLDRMTAGLHPGELILLAARPSMGKSALALNIAEHAARATKKWALFFSIEMDNRSQGLRMLAAHSHVNVQRLITGRIYEQEWPRVSEAMAALHEIPLLLNQQASLTVMDLRALARRAQREFPPGISLIVVDYLQLMVAGDNESNRATQLGEISRGLKLLAKEMQVPVIALSQLNRELEKRVDKRPVMSDLRDSGALEQDADVIMFIYRDEVYRPQSDDRGMAEIILRKQRNGPVGMVRLAFHADRTRFENYAAQMDSGLR